MCISTRHIGIRRIQTKETLNANDGHRLKWSRCHFSGGTMNAKDTKFQKLLLFKIARFKRDCKKLPPLEVPEKIKQIIKEQQYDK